MTREQSSEPPETLPSTSTTYTLRSLLPTIPCLRRTRSKRLSPRRLTRVLLPLVHLLLELPRLLLVHETQPEQALLPLEAVEERSILVVLEGIVDLLIPQHAAKCRRNIDKLEPERVAHQVVGQDRGALQAGGYPLSVVGEGDVEFGDGDGLDLVVGLGDGALDRLLVIVGEDGGHCGGMDRYERALGPVF